MAALLWLLAFAGLLDCTQSAPAVDWSSAPAVPLASGQLQLQQATVRVIRLSGFCNYRVALKANDTPFHAAWGVSSEWELLTRPANSTRCEVGPVHTSEHSVQHSSDETALFLIGPPHEADYGILDLRLQGKRPSAQILSGLCACIIDAPCHFSLTRKRCMWPAPSPAGTPIGCSDGSAVLPSLAQTAAVQLQLDSPASIYPLHHSGNTLGPVVDWARSQGAQLPKLVPAAFGRVRGMRALHDIGAKEVFLSLPRKLCLQVGVAASGSMELLRDAWHPVVGLDRPGELLACSLTSLVQPAASVVIGSRCSCRSAGLRAALVPRKLCDGGVDPGKGQHAQWCCDDLQVVEGESTPNPVPHLVSNRVWRLMGGGHYTDL